MSTLGLAGLASGVDTNAIVDQLMALERQKLTRLSLRQTAVEARKADLTAIASKLSALKTAAADLRAAATWEPKQTVESSDPTRVAVEKVSGAGVGGNTIDVDRLASSAQRTYAWKPGDGAGLGADATLDLTANGTTTSIAFTAGTTLAQVVEKINARSDLPVYAAEVSGQLVLSARKTGDGSVFTAAGTLVGTSGIEEDAAKAKTTGLNALYRLDGATTASESQSNVLEDTIAGLRLTLKGVTSSAVSISVGEAALDKDAVKGKVKAFVDAYNAVVDLTRSELSERRVPNATNRTDASKGTLFGDSGMGAMLSRMRQDMAQVIGGLGTIDDLADIGVSVPATSGGTSTADARAGKLVIDDAKLGEMLAADWTQVRSFFQGSSTVDGLSKRIEAFVDSQTGNDGVIDSRQDSAKDEIDRLADEMKRADERLALKEKRMRAQFAAMELALQNSQSQQAWLTGQLNALTAQQR